MIAQSIQKKIILAAVQIFPIGIYRYFQSHITILSFWQITHTEKNKKNKRKSEEEREENIFIKRLDFVFVHWNNPKKNKG